MTLLKVRKAAKVLTNSSNVNRFKSGNIYTPAHTHTIIYYVFLAEFSYIHTTKLNRTNKSAKNNFFEVSLIAAFFMDQGVRERPYTIQPPTSNKGGN